MDIASVVLRKPEAEDGFFVNKLISEIPELDSNSCYCNLLQCSHFSDTSVLAEIEGEVVGFISGYRKPNDSDVLFVWQVAVAQKARGMGLASKMLQQLLQRKVPSPVSHIETTITDDNEASWALFNRLARDANATLVRSLIFDRCDHFNEQHDSEFLARIGPFLP
ncbi:diaminobutyrate acetyltransferase [Amphritea opalescens]|uniref:L-2,4-diaminobutyric acid acetyltransferase n=1 Tax=Amphritea opalescens TaxID=2490544 RepID=A0A430KSI0_9GAMM|nr:diaminobutyrate acetyltransferase [Amphritea opalescens]RTE66294.1 diaminobutyrate acetyltransferase [Amphritea opalescens]